MSEDTLYDQDVYIVVIKMRSHAVAQGMAGDVKGHLEWSVAQDFFQIIFHGADRQTVALFGDKQCRGKPAI